MTTSALRAPEIENEPAPRAFVPSELERMREAGIVRQDDAVELIGGVPCRNGAGRATLLRFSVEDYHRLAEIGVLARDERVELIDGVIYAMSPMGSEHAACIRALQQLITEQSHGNRFLLSVQSPIRIGRSEPEPDLALLRPKSDFYRNRHPGPEDIFLLIEVMSTSATYDRGRKLFLYAAAGIEETWLVDLDREVVEVHEAPERGVYTRSHVRGRGETLAMRAFPDVVIDVDAVLV